MHQSMCEYVPVRLRAFIASSQQITIVDLHMKIRSGSVRLACLLRQYTFMHAHACMVISIEIQCIEPHRHLDRELHENHGQTQQPDSVSLQLRSDTGLVDAGAGHSIAVAVDSGYPSPST